jgi:hypothetical protein
VFDLVPEQDNELDQVNLPRDVGELREHVHELAAKLVIFDPIVAGIDVSLDAHKDEHVRHVLAQLSAMAEAEECVCALVGHLNKTPSSDAYIRVAGSVAFWNASRSVVLVVEDDPEKPEDNRLIVQRKANWSRLCPVQRHRIDEVMVSAGDEQILIPRMTFVEFAQDVEGADVLTSSPRGDTKLAHAEKFLAGALADGEWHSSAPLKEQLKTFGISDRTVKDAAGKLGVEYEAQRGVGSGAPTCWRLRAGTPAPEVPAHPELPRAGTPLAPPVCPPACPPGEAVSETGSRPAGSTGGQTLGAGRAAAHPRAGTQPSQACPPVLADGAESVPSVPPSPPQPLAHRAGGQESVTPDTAPDPDSLTEEEIFTVLERHLDPEEVRGWFSQPEPVYRKYAADLLALERQQSGAAQHAPAGGRSSAPVGGDSGLPPDEEQRAAGRRGENAGAGQAPVPGQEGFIDLLDEEHQAGRVSAEQRKARRLEHLRTVGANEGVK